jgi:hypothetical protein
MGGGIWEDMCYERRRAEACVEEDRRIVEEMCYEIRRPQSGPMEMCVCVERGPNRPVVKLCSPYPRLFLFGITKSWIPFFVRINL